jgi:hypothetical protein
MRPGETPAFFIWKSAHLTRKRPKVIDGCQGLIGSSENAYQREPNVKPKEKQS